MGTGLSWFRTTQRHMRYCSDGGTQACFWPTAGGSSSVTRDHSRVNWEELVRCYLRANETYSKAKHQLSVRNIDALTMPSPLISGGPLLSLLCSARAHRCFHLLVGVADRCARRKEICCRIIFMASSRRSLLICCLCAICLLVLSHLPSGRARLGVSC